jgi:secreted PhoX family phosphatase
VGCGECFSDQPEHRTLTMSPLNRRSFLHRATLSALGAGFAPSLSGLVRLAEHSGIAPRDRERKADYGPLVAAGPELALPEGFHYARFGLGGTPLTNGTTTPGGHDGMACFATGRRDIVRLVRNHELAGPRGQFDLWHAVGDPALAYDPKGTGGTSTLELRLRRNTAPELLSAWMSLTGTLVNCAGGPTPWGSWLSCEETTIGTERGLPKDHGYVFEVPSSSNAPAEPVPLKAMGRFVHEALAVDPNTQVVYLTEDQLSAGFYRFIPNARQNRMRAGSLREGGRLQALALKDAWAHDTRKGQRAGSTYSVSWVDIAEAEPRDGSPGTVFNQGLSKGAATFGRLEGAWWGDSSVYFHATSGGDRQLGQVWRYRPGRDLSGGPVADGGQLILVYESTGPESLQSPDNITMSPRGGLVLCEDGANNCRLHGLSPQGEIFPFAKNIFNQREFAGACFSPDGQVLFVNIQGGTGETTNDDLGMSFAIWGPWERGAL